MGSLALPASGGVYADAQIVIYTVEGHLVFGPPLEPLWQAAQTGQFVIVTSEITVLETLVGPYKTGNAVHEKGFEDVFRSPEVRLEPITPAILRAAARLRAAIPKLRTPDAIHAATSQAAGCSLFVTNDPVFRAVPGLTVVVLRDVLARP